MLLAKVQQVSTVDWRLFCPNIFTSVEPNGFGFLEADFSTHRIRRVADGKRENLESMTAVATEIYTNPPFQTVKGMASSMKEHLKKHFPNAKCDLCNAFILQCIDKIQTGGTIGLVTQSSWMYLDSFENLRRELITNNTIESIADLGSGAFYDLSGEKANVALVRVTKTPYANACVKVLTLRDIPLKEKAAVLGKASDSVLLMQQAQLFGGEHMDYVRKQPLFNSQYRRWKFIAVCSAVDDDVKARYDSQKSKGKKGLVAEIDNYEVYALTWDDVFQSFDLRHAFLLDKLKMDKEAIAAEIAQTAGDEKSKDTADALTALVAN